MIHFKCGKQSCDGVLEFDGSDLTLLNMGSYLLSYEVLRDFMFHFLKGRYVNNNNNNNYYYLLELFCCCC